MGGNSSDRSPGVYGVLGVPAPANIPPAHMGGATWTDSRGHLWLFGGAGYNPGGNWRYLNDLWQFDPANNQWAWMSGSTNEGDTLGWLNGVYGTLGVPAASNVPGSREAAVSWIDRSDHLWLFGGWGHDSTGKLGWLNDLWKFDASTNQ